MPDAVIPHDPTTDPIKSQIIEQAGQPTITRWTAPSGRKLVLADDPHPMLHKSPAGAAVQTAILEWRRLETLAHKSGGFLPDPKERSKAMEAVRNAATEVSTESARVFVDEEALFAPPRPADAVEALEDREIRDWLESLPSDRRATAMRDLSGRLALACARSPRPLGGYQQKALAMHRQRVEEDKPDAVKLLRLRKESVERARVAMSSITGLISRIPQR